MTKLDKKIKDTIVKTFIMETILEEDYDNLVSQIKKLIREEILKEYDKVEFIDDFKKFIKDILEPNQSK